MDAQKVGRILTVERVKELNAKDWFYRVLKDNPKMSSIFPGVEDDLMKGAIDHHIHSYPDFVWRGQDMIEVAVEAAKSGMRAIAFKDHYNLTAGNAYLTQRHIEHLVKTGVLDEGVEVYGGIGLNFGMNPDTVKIALKYPNMKMIWFPTFHSAGYFRSAGKNEKGIAMVGKNGGVLPEVTEIMQMAAESRVGIGLGHTDFHELLPLCAKAKEIGARVVLDHPLLELNKLTLDEMRQCADLGAYVGTYCQPMIPSLYQPVADPFETVETIKAIGAERCIIGSDFGQVLHINTVDGIKVFVRALLAFGISKEEINIMLKRNPARLMYLED